MIHIIPILKVGNNASIVVEHKKSILKEGIIARITEAHTRINFKEGNDFKTASKIISKEGKDVIKAASSLVKGFSLLLWKTTESAISAVQKQRRAKSE